MDTAAKHYKFINTKTGNVIYYHSVDVTLQGDELKAELEKIKDQVAINNGIYRETVYWQEFTDTDRK